MANRKRNVRDREHRRREREERERQQQRAAARKRALEIGGGVAIAVGLIGGIAIAMQGGGGGGGTGEAVDGAVAGGLPIPRRQITELQPAVTAAGCVLRRFESEGQEHTDDPRAVSDYDTNPPTSGSHHPVWARDGYYLPGAEPDLGHWVHALEHGRIVFQYRPGTPARRERQLRTLFGENVKGGGASYHLLALRNNTRMQPAVAAVAWTRYVTCDTFNDRTFDALRAFRDEFVDEGPEQVP